MAHLHEKIDFTVEVFIVHKDKVLLRLHDKLKIWLSVGGHIEPDEDPNQAAIREVKEEVGLDVKLAGMIADTGELGNDKYRELLVPRYLNRHHISATHEHICLVYFATADSDKVTVTYQGDKSEDWKWFTKEDLQTAGLRPNIKFYALKALEALATYA